MTPSSKLTFAPLYEQVKKAILNRIIAGEWGPGSFLPSEIALAKEYGVSQGTLRKALNALTREKRLVRYQGKGTAVAVLDEDSSLFPFFLLSFLPGFPSLTSSSYPIFSLFLLPPFICFCFVSFPLCLLSRRSFSC